MGVGPNCAPFDCAAAEGYADMDGNGTRACGVHVYYAETNAYFPYVWKSALGVY